MSIVWLKDVRAQDLDRMGGKAAALGELVRVEMPVPSGLVLTTDAYRWFVTANGLQAQIMDLAAQASGSDPASYERVSTQIHDAFQAGRVPQDLADAIHQAYAELVDLGHDAVAVRSSATAEDLPTASFAGQQETFLNVRGADALVEAIKACWASLWTARALAYRERQGIDHEQVAMAVVVQTMVPAEVSGILFTANPATGERDELVVNASYGLGESIVSGAITPDTYVLDRTDLTSKQIDLGSKEEEVVPQVESDAGDSRTITRPVSESRRRAAALSGPLLAELGALGVEVETLFNGVPQDIEWAVTGGCIWLLQSRPITDLPPAPLRDVRWDPPVPGTVWMRRQVVEHMPDPLSPLFAELYLREGLTQSIQDLMTFMSDLTESRDIERLMKDAIPASFAVTVNGYAYSVASFNFSWDLVPAILRIYATTVPAMIRHLEPYWRDQAVPVYVSVIDRWKAMEPSELSDQNLLQGVQELATADAVYWFAAAIPLGLARVTDAVLDRFLKSSLKEAEATGASVRATSGPYLRGFPSKAMQAQAELDTIAHTIHASAALEEIVLATPAPRLLDRLAAQAEGQPVLDALDDYLDRYGHQIYNLDFAVPTQADEPLPVLIGLKAAVEHPERDALSHQRSLARERDALIERTQQTLNPVQRRLFRLLLGWAQRYTPYREEALFYVGAAWPTLRKLALELGRRLAKVGSLDDADDVFYLESTELEAASASRRNGEGRPGLARLAQERRRLRAARQQLEPPVSVPPNATLQFGPIRMAMFEPQPIVAGHGPTLNGFAVSPGRVTARASIIRSPEEFEKMEPDTILVCPTTTPAWTPLFSQASGLVTDIGGALAHGSIVAREYGIPAVMGTGTATQRIRNGQSIQVDGDTGTVTLLEETVGEPEQAAVVAGTGATRTPSLAGKKWVFALAAGAVGLLLWWRSRRRRA